MSARRARPTPPRTGRGTGPSNPWPVRIIAIVAAAVVVAAVIVAAAQGVLFTAPGGR
jgi:hypothetical protein